ncbi:type IV pilus assembly protein PilA [Bacillus tianshenii]|uniref:Type IV pilus assembly protein PilA n=2 Tax=Sutcliffiella tianshenii TaxID=1463404 RepID=A0ABS2P0H4_9BACI|nr:type IV pilus assembly protein PilA [Bacillus tianshenii]
MLKNEKGLTLIELLAVVVILGIIAAIAVPSIGKLIDNSKVDAHVANAEQVVSAARLAATSDSSISVGSKFVSLEYLISKGFLEQIQDPDDKNKSYKQGNKSNAAVDTIADTHSYVQLLDGKVIGVNLVGENRSVKATANTGGNLVINKSSVTNN